MERKIPYTPQVALYTLNELMKGPLDDEVKKGYRACVVPYFVSMKDVSITIKNGNAYVDIKDDGARGSSGAIWCNLPASTERAIKESITNTLRQFPAIQNVIFTTNGKICENLGDHNG